MVCALQRPRIACPEPSSHTSDGAGMRYLIEVRIAKEVIRVWRAWREGKLPTLQEQCDAIIYYAVNDSYQPV